MLGNSAIVPVLPTADISRAREFYTNTLGLTEVAFPIEERYDDALLLRSGVGLLLIYERALPSPPQHTQAGWMVEDFDAVIDGLIDRGLKFETYLGMPDTTWDARGVASRPGGLRSAWFLDPDGNILAINQAVPIN